MSDLIDAIIDREGGFVDHAADRGGPTKYGITLRTLSDWRGVAASAADVASLTREEAHAIYSDRYVTRPRFGAIADLRLRELVIDAGVLHGPARAARWLQQAAGVTTDGVIGPVTLSAVNAADADLLFRRFAVQRIRAIGRLVTDDPSQAVFAAGWLNRATEFLLG